jgi:hypothetical protein
MEYPTTLKEILQRNDMGCIKTGITVFFPEYNATMRADLFRCKDVLYIRANPESTQYGPFSACDLIVRSSFEDGYWNMDEGQFVVPFNNNMTLEY